MSSLHVQVDGQQLEVDCQPFDDLHKIRDKVFLMHNVQLDGFALHLLENGVAAPAALSESAPLSALGVGARSMLIARKKDAPALTVDAAAAEEPRTPRLTRHNSMGAQRSPQPSTMQQQMHNQPTQYSLNSPPAQPQHVRRASLAPPSTNPFGQVEDSLAAMSPRSPMSGVPASPRSPGASGQHSRQASSGLPLSPGAGGGIQVRARTGNLSFGQGTWPGKRPTGMPLSPDSIPNNWPPAALQPVNSSGSNTPSRSPRPAVIVTNYRTQAAGGNGAPSLQRTESSPLMQANVFATLELELSPHPLRGGAPNQSPSSHRGSVSSAAGAVAVPRSPNPFAAIEQQQAMEQSVQLQMPAQGSRRPSQITSSHAGALQQPSQLGQVDEAYRASANPSPTQAAQGAPSPLTRAGSLTSSTPSSVSVRSRANSLSSNAPSLTLPANPFALMEEVLSPHNLSRRPSAMIGSAAAAKAGSPASAAAVPAAIPPPVEALPEPVSAHDKLGQLFGLQPSPVRPSPELVEPTSAAASTASSSAADIRTSCASLRQLSPHLSLLLDAVTLESHDQARDRSETLELREYKLAETQAHIRRIQNAREAQVREHAQQLEAINAKIAAAQEVALEEERKSAAQTVVLNEERSALEARLTAIERRTNAHTLELLQRKSELDAWAAGVHRQQLAELAMLREEHDLAAAGERNKLVDRVVEQLLQAPDDVVEQVVQRIAAKRQQRAKAAAPKDSGTGASAAAE